MGDVDGGKMLNTGPGDGAAGGVDKGWRLTGPGSCQVAAPANGSNTTTAPRTAHPQVISALLLHCPLHRCSVQYSVDYYYYYCTWTRRRWYDSILCPVTSQPFRTRRILRVLHRSESTRRLQFLHLRGSRRTAQPAREQIGADEYSVAFPIWGSGSGAQSLSMDVMHSATHVFLLSTWALPQRTSRSLK